MLLEEFNFCSLECLKKFVNSIENVEDYKIYEVTRCVGYYDCKKLSNLRRMCESVVPLEVEDITSSRVSAFEVLAAKAMYPSCSPAEVGIIKSSIKLLDIFEKFDREATKINKEMLHHTREMNRLTKLILAFTILNLIILVIYTIMEIS